MAFNMYPPSGTQTTTQIKVPFNGHLNPNEVYKSLYNMIISQDVRYPELADNYGFVEMFRTDGTLMGDTKLFYASDILKSRPWLGDNEAQNLLQTERAPDPKVQAIVLNEFRIIKTTTDQYLSKRGWSTLDAFSSFNSLLRALVGETKKIYEIMLINTYIGTTEGEANKSMQELPLSELIPEAITGEERNRLEAQYIAQKVADLFVAMKDFSRDFNDYKFMRAYRESELMIIWNGAYVNKINKLDLPTIFNNNGLMDKFAQHILPDRYFGEVITAIDGTFTGTVTEGQEIRSLVEEDYTSGHLFPGEMLAVGDTYEANKVYVVDADIICKIVTKDTFKYMSAFTTATEFYNPQALLSNNMLIWGYAHPDRLLDQPLVTLHAD